MADAVVIGAGPNGLVAANLLADAGWEVDVLEAQDEPGGAMRSGEVTEPGYVHDRFSSFYPFAMISPPLLSFDLEAHGVRWRRSPLVVGHPEEDGACAFISENLEETAASLEAHGAGDGEAWRGLVRRWQAVAPGFTEAFFAPFPPVRGGARMAASVPPRDLLRLARFMALPVRRMAEEHFRGPGGGNLLAGAALHADLAPEAIGSGAFGWIMASLGQEHGFPTVEGGASRLAGALADRLRARGGRVTCSAEVERVVVRRGRAVGVRTRRGDEVEARRAVLGAVDAPTLYRELLGEEHLSRREREDLDAFEWDNSTIKVDWSLDGPIPWSAPDARRAGTIHVTRGMDGLTETMAEMHTKRIPRRPCIVFGQYSMTDPTRQPAGKETAWGYAHVPQRVVGDAGGELSGRWDRDEVERFAERMEAEIEALAPGFRALVRSRALQGPRALEDADGNLVGGALNGGTAHLYQLAMFRPGPGQAGRPEGPVRGLYLASASAHPAGGVHGAPGAIAARAALARHARRRVYAIDGAGAAAAAVAARGAAR